MTVTQRTTVTLQPLLLGKKEMRGRVCPDLTGWLESSSLDPSQLFIVSDLKIYFKIIIFNTELNNNSDTIIYIAIIQ